MPFAHALPPVAGIYLGTTKVNQIVACAALHHKVLDGVDSPAAKAILAFFDSWEPDTAPPTRCWQSSGPT